MEFHTNVGLTPMDLPTADFDHGLEAHSPLLWREVRAERADALLLQPEGRALGVAGRWDPVFRSVLGALRRQAVDREEDRSRMEQMQQELQAMQHRVSKPRQGGNNV